MQTLLKYFFLILMVQACTPNNVKIDHQIGLLLDSAHMKGSFALMENGTEHFTIYNLSMYKDSGAAPLSTFFIIPALMGLDKGLLKFNDSSLHLNDSSDLFTGLISKLGRTEIIKTLDSLHYGKGIVSADSNHFWEDQSLQITADEQLGLMKRLYFKELFFQQKSQEKIKQMLLIEDNSNYRLSYLMGTDTLSNVNVSWMVGYVEENKHPYFFVLRTNAQNPNSLKEQNIQLLKKILIQQGFLQGTR